MSSQSQEIQEILDDPAQASRMRNHWVAIDPDGGDGIVALRSGATIVDHDEEIDQLFCRLSEARKTSLTICYVGERRPPRA